MFSFKYHLLTICAVFLALAVGLLLGAAIGGSGLLSTTTSDLVESLSKDFTDLNKRNDELTLEVSEYSALSGTFIDQWQPGKLAGRDVMIVAGSSNEQRSAAQEVAKYVAAAGGRYAILQVNTVALGTGDEAISAALRNLVPDVAGRDYADVLADALAAEWTRGQHVDAVFDGGQMSSARDLTDEDRATYPVTSYLLTYGMVTIINSSSIPDTVNGCVDVLVYPSETTVPEGAEGTDAAAETVYTVDPMGVRIGSAFAAMGAPVVFTQDKSASAPLMDEASSRNVAGVGSYAGNMGRYSLIRLLVAPSQGIYGPEQNAAYWYPMFSNATAADAIAAAA